MKEENKKDMLKRLLFIAKKLSEKTKRKQQLLCNHSLRYGAAEKGNP